MPEPVAWTLVRRGLGDPAVAREFMASDGPLAPAEDAARHRRGGRPPGARGARAASGSPCTATTTATASAPPPILVRALRGARRRRRAVPAEPLHRGLRRGRRDGRRCWPTRGARVLVCVDCGTSAVAALTRAVDARHGADRARPPPGGRAPAAGHPGQPGAGPAGRGPPGRRRGGAHAGARARRRGWTAARLALDADEGIDLVALATVADAVPLVGDNRRRVAQGLRAMRERPRPGIAALCAAAGLEPRTHRRPRARLHPGARHQRRRAARPPRARPRAAAGGRPRDGRPDRRRSCGRSTRSAARWSGRSSSEADGPGRGRARRDPRARGSSWRPATAGTRASSGSSPRAWPSASSGRRSCSRARATRAKGSGRSLPGVDLHALVAAAGGHADALGRAPRRGGTGAAGRRRSRASATS